MAQIESTGRRAVAARGRLDTRQFENLAIFLIGAIVIAVVGVFGWPSLKSADWAAWVQAVGSVAAIAVAVWYPEWRHRIAADQADEQRRSTLMGQIESARLLFAEISSALLQTEQKIASSTTSDVRLSELRVNDWLTRMRHFEQVLPRNCYVHLLDARLNMEPVFLHMDNRDVFPISAKDLEEIRVRLESHNAQMSLHVDDVAQGFPPMRGDQRAYRKQCEEWIAQGVYRGAPLPPRKKILPRPGKEMSSY